MSMTLNLKSSLRTKYVLPTGQEVVLRNTFFTCPSDNNRVVVNGQDYYMTKQYTEHFVDEGADETVTQSVIMLGSFQLLQEVM